MTKIRSWQDFKDQWNIEWSRFTATSEDDHRYIKQQFIDAYNDLKRFEIVQVFYWIIIVIVCMIFAGLWAGSVLALLLSHEVFLLILTLIGLNATVYIYYKEFLGYDFFNDCKRLSERLVGVRSLFKSVLKKG